MIANPPVKGEFPACARRSPADLSGMLIAWTTVANRADADRLAADAVARNLAVCVQIDGPIVSHFRWEGRDHREEEFRLCFKVLASHASALEQHVLAHHPYAVPE